MTRFNFYRPNLFDETNSLFARWDDVVLHTQSKQKRVKHCIRFIMFAHGIRFEWWFFLNAGIARRHSIPTTKIASFHGSNERKQPYLHIHTHTHTLHFHTHNRWIAGWNEEDYECNDNVWVVVSIFRCWPNLHRFRSVAMCITVFHTRRVTIQH